MGYSLALSERPIRASRAMACSLAAAAVFFFRVTGAMVMFCSTVLWGNRLKCWNTMPIFWRCRSIFTALPARSAPSKKMAPEVGCSSRFRLRSSVDLPEPEGPMIATTSPLRMSRLQSFRAWTAP